MGLHTLAHMNDLKAAAFPMNVIATRRSFLEKNRDVVKRFLQAYSEATYQFMTNKQKALAIYNQRLKQKDASVVEETYKYFAANFSFPPRVSHESWRRAQTLCRAGHQEPSYDQSGPAKPHGSVR